MKEYRSQHHFFRQPENGMFAKNSRYISVPSSQQKLPSIIHGKFNYNEAFAAFVKGTQQKKDTASITGVFTQKLQEKQVLLPKKQPIKVADIGCANSTTCLHYLRNINHFLGFDYVGIDTNQDFLQEAKAILSSDPIIKKYALILDDALSGRLKEREELASSAFEFVFVSHIAYYIKDELSGRAFLEDIIKLLSKQCGIALFFHEDSTYYFRSTYNRKEFHTMTTPELLEKSARWLPANFNQFKSISFTSKLHFSPLSEELWETAKYPNLYKNFVHNTDFIDTLEKLAFVVQRDLIGLAKEGLLSRYIDEIKDAISDNNNCLDLETRMQTLVAPQCTLRHKIAKALKETEEEIPGILHREIESRCKIEKTI